MGLQNELNQTAKNYSLFVKDLSEAEAFKNYLYLMENESFKAFIKWPYQLGGDDIFTSVIQQTCIKTIDIIFSVFSSKNDMIQIN